MIVILALCGAGAFGAFLGEPTGLRWIYLGIALFDGWIATREIWRKEEWEAPDA